MEISPAENSESYTEADLITMTATMHLTP